MALPKIPSLSVWQQALLHALLVWFFFNLYDSGTYAYRVATDGYFLFLEDGTPFTTWNRFLSANLSVGGLILAGVPFLLEVNYHLVLQKKGIKSFIVASMILALGVLTLLIVTRHPPLNFLVDAPRFIGPFLALLAYCFAYALVRYAIQQKIKQADAATQQTQAELNALKAYLNPHFFFNTLNNLYGTALQEKAEKTAKSLAQLSGIMRYVLTEAQQDTTDIKNELAFLEDYLQLQRMRLPNRPNITLQTSITYDGQPAQIAPLLLIPFLENAFKYGISLDHPCFVHLKLEVKEQQVDFALENQILPDCQADKGAGTGIAHVRQRLALLYPQRHQLDISQDGKYRVRLQLNLR